MGTNTGSAPLHAKKSSSKIVIPGKTIEYMIVDRVYGWYWRS